jgi:hypothetical protein
MLKNTRTRSFIIVLSSIFVIGCAGYSSYETKVVPFKLPAAYPGSVEAGGAVIAAQAYGDPKEAEAVFGFNMIGAGILPVRVIFDNKGTHPLEIVPAQTFLVDDGQNLWPILEQRLAYERMQKKTEFGKAIPEAAKYGGLGGLAGGVIGAAIGIVSGHNVGDAAMKGAVVGAAAGATVGGSKGLTDTDVQERIRADLDQRSLENRSVKAGEIAYGFIFFPGEATKKPTELRLQVREVDTKKTYPLVLKF